MGISFTQVNATLPMMISTPYKALLFARDLFDVLILDRANKTRRRGSELASAYCRQIRFHSRSRIKPIGWEKLQNLLGGKSMGVVQIPSPATKFGNVGSGDYYSALATLTQCIQPRKIFEFGTYLGVSALTFAANSNSTCEIYTLDLPNDSDADSLHQLNSLDENLVNHSRNKVGEAFHASEHAHRITQIFADSMSFNPDHAHLYADLVFVDGGHSTPLVTKDTENAFKILSKSGVIVWDDYFHAYPDIVRYLDGLSEKMTLYNIHGTNLVIHKISWDS